MILIIAITLVAVVSVATGIGKGIKWLSNANMFIAGGILLFVLIVGPTLFLLRDFVQSIGVYLQNVLPMTFNVSAYTGADGEAWQSAWSTFYWGWWISWAPFVGVFIARISRGRTVREFVAGVLIVPTAVTFLWFAVMGGAGLHRELFGDGGIVGADGTVDEDFAMFDLLDGMTGGVVVSVVTMLLIVLFFVTSSDSGSLVIDMLGSGGDPDPPLWSRVFWASTEGAVAIALLLAGGLLALRTMAILIALPFSVIMLGMRVATWRALHQEHQAHLRAQARQERRELTDHLEEHFDGRFEEVLAEAENGPGAGGADAGDVEAGVGAGAGARVRAALGRRSKPFRRT